MVVQFVGIIAEFGRHPIPALAALDHHGAITPVVEVIAVIGVETAHPIETVLRAVHRQPLARSDPCFVPIVGEGYAAAHNFQPHDSVPFSLDAEGTLVEAGD